MRSNVKSGAKKGHFFHDDLKKLIDYVYCDEQKDYMCGPSRNHIHLTIRRLAKRIGYIKEEKSV